jgi:hypothetical protein
VKRKIVGFHPDEVGAWVAVLEREHSRHMRHKPPGRTAPGCSRPKAASASLGSRSTTERVTQKGRTTVVHMQRWTGATWL